MSTLRRGTPLGAEKPDGNWESVTVQAASLSVPGQRVIGRLVRELAEPLPWGPVELEISLRVGAESNWVCGWKPLIDSLVGLLGRAPGRTEFDIEDGRIVALGLHREIDASLGHAVEARVWWRSEASGGGPPLSYEPIDALVSPPATALVRRGEPSDRVELITTLERLHVVQATPGGYVVITDTARPPRLHVADCTAVVERLFVTKVLENAMKNGQYFFVANVAQAGRVWPSLAAHDCA